MVGPGVGWTTQMRNTHQGDVSPWRPRECWRCGILRELKWIS